MSTKRRIQMTKNYRLFTSNVGENRPLDMKKHKKLFASMELYGFLPSYPIIVFRDKRGDMIVKDGQHRLAVAESLGLTVHYVEEVIDYDVAIVNDAQKSWQTKDYALKWSANGFKDYQEGIEFAETHNLPIGTAFALLAGTTNFSNIDSDYKSGWFKVKDRKWAQSVAAIYAPMVALSSNLKHIAFIEACMAICRVPEFDPNRMLHNAEHRCRELLLKFGNREANLDMLEKVYNFGRVKLVGLKAAATMAMRERSATTKTKEAAKEKQLKETSAAA